MSVTALVLAGGASRRMGRNKLELPVVPGGQVTILEHVIHVVASVADSVTLLVPPDFSHGDWGQRNVSLVTDEDAYKGPLAALAHGWPATYTGNVSQHEAGTNKNKATSLNGRAGSCLGSGTASVDRSVSPSATNQVLVVAGDYPGLQSAVLFSCIHQFTRAMEASRAMSPPVTAPSSAANPLAGTPSHIPVQPPIDGVVLRREGRLQPLLGCYAEGVGTLLHQEAASGEHKLMRAVAKLRLIPLDVTSVGWPDWWTRPVHTPADYQDWLQQNTSQGGTDDET